jgi:outer membrane biogenesis lipoprotein LolB
MICSMKALLSLATLLLVACAAKAPEPKAIAPAATTDANGNAQTAADRRFSEETRGYKQVERNGQKYYCRPERASGSNIKAMNCFSENELRARVEDAEAYRRRSKPSVCAPDDPRCGGS